MTVPIPYHRPAIGEEEIAEVTAVLRSGWLTTGPKTAEFEHEFRTSIGVPHALAVNSCTAGLHLALEALGIGPGDEVITTPLTFCATVNVILHAGATPVLADIGADGNIDPDAIASRITPRTRAIIPVHFAGLPCDMESIWRLANAREIEVIEDGAHASGATYRGWPIGAGDPVSGNYSAACAFSFYATKNMTTGEGGMVTTHNDALADRMRVLCLHGISRDAWNRYSAKGKWRYEVLEAGFKYNLSDVQSAIGLRQLRKLDGFTEIRRRYARLYNELLSGCHEVDTPEERFDSGHAWHLYVLRLNLDQLSIDRDQFITELARRGVGTSVHFIPIPLHAFFARYAERTENQCPRALALFQRIISLPLYPSMEEEQVVYVAKAVQEIATRHRRRRTMAACAAVGAD